MFSIPQIKLRKIQTILRRNPTDKILPTPTSVNSTSSFSLFPSISGLTSIFHDNRGETIAEQKHDIVSILDFLSKKDGRGGDSQSSKTCQA